jgi:hypothetical protein
VDGATYEVTVRRQCEIFRNFPFLGKYKVLFVTCKKFCPEACTEKTAWVFRSIDANEAENNQGKLVK